MNILPKQIIALLSVIFIVPTTAIIGCGDKRMEKNNVTYDSLDNVPDNELKKLSELKIYFGHQSVGNNIIEGIEDLKKENAAIGLNIIDTDSLNGVKRGTLAHSKIGKNRQINSKFKDFEDILTNGNGNNFDVAFMKSCYVDITEDTDIKSMFASYQETMNRIKTARPDIKIIHFTVPVETKKIPFGHWMRIFRSAGWSYRLVMVKNFAKMWRNEANINRQRYNDMILKEFKDKEPVFDIAKYESTNPDGKRESHSKNGETYYSMVPGYSDDGGHLNEVGRKIIAERLLLYLIKI